MRKRTLGIVLLSLIACGAMAFGLSACDIGGITDVPGSGDTDVVAPDDSFTDADSGTASEILTVYKLYAEAAEAAGGEILSYDDWLDSIRGTNGKDGEDGVGIDTIELKEKKDGEDPDPLVDTYVITLTNGETFEFSVTNGVGIKSIQLEDPKEDDDSLVDTYVITFTNGETYQFTITNGTVGADGKSAYEIAVKNGFNGTEEDWLASLKGADGADGKDAAEHTHTYGDVVTVEGTCTTIGYSFKTCTECGYIVYTEFTDVQHTWNDGIEITIGEQTEADADEDVDENDDGETVDETVEYTYTFYICTKCGATKIVCNEFVSEGAPETDFTEHNFATPTENDWTWPDTADGNTISVSLALACQDTDCARVITYNIDAYTTTNTATCTEGGKAAYLATITINGAEYTSQKEYEIDAMGHALTLHEATKPTCQTYESIECLYCTRCEKYFDITDNTKELQSSDVYKSLGDHNYIYESTMIVPTYAYGGVDIMVCEYCGAKTYGNETSALTASISLDSGTYTGSTTITLTPYYGNVYYLFDEDNHIAGDDADTRDGERLEPTYEGYYHCEGEYLTEEELLSQYSDRLYTDSTGSLIFDENELLGNTLDFTRKFTSQGNYTFTVSENAPIVIITGGFETIAIGKEYSSFTGTSFFEAFASAEIYIEVNTTTTIDISVSDYEYVEPGASAGSAIAITTTKYNSTTSTYTKTLTSGQKLYFSLTRASSQDYNYAYVYIPTGLVLYKYNADGEVEEKQTAVDPEEKKKCEGYDAYLFHVYVETGAIFYVENESETDIELSLFTDGSIVLETERMTENNHDYTFTLDLEDLIYGYRLTFSVYGTVKATATLTLENGTTTTIDISIYNYQGLDTRTPLKEILESDIDLVNPNDFCFIMYKGTQYTSGTVTVTFSINN